MEVTAGVIMNQTRFCVRNLFKVNLIQILELLLS